MMTENPENGLDQATQISRAAVQSMFGVLQRGRTLDTQIVVAGNPWITRIQVDRETPTFQMEGGFLHRTLGIYVPGKLSPVPISNILDDFYADQNAVSLILTEMSREEEARSIGEVVDETDHTMNVLRGGLHVNVFYGIPPTQIVTTSDSGMATYSVPAPHD